MDVHTIATVAVLWPALLEPVVATLQPALPDLDLLGPLSMLLELLIGIIYSTATMACAQHSRVLYTEACSLTAPVALVLVQWFSPSALGFVCTWIYNVLSGPTRISAVLVTLRVCDLAVGLGAGLCLVQSILSLCVHFVFLVLLFISASS